MCRAKVNLVMAANPTPKRCSAPKNQLLHGSHPTCCCEPLRVCFEHLHHHVLDGAVLVLALHLLVIPKRQKLLATCQAYKLTRSGDSSISGTRPEGPPLTKLLIRQQVGAA